MQTPQSRNRTVSYQKADVLWVVPDKPDNISTGRQRIAAGLRDRGHAVQLVADRRDAITAARQGFDAVLSTTPFGGLVGPLAKRNGSKYVVDYVDPITQLFASSGYVNATAGYGLQHAAFRAADGILYVYDEERHRVENRGVPVRKTTLGVDYSRFADPAGTVEDRAAAVLDSAGVEGDFAVYIGGLEPIYNIEAMLSAFEHTDAPLVIAGTGSKRAAVEAAARTHENITSLGLIDHEIVPGVLSKASAGLCLVDDPHTVKVLEYGAAGVPVVQLQGRARAELPRDSVHWCNTDPADIAHAVDDALAARPSAELDGYARQHDYQQVITDYENMIREVL